MDKREEWVSSIGKLQIGNKIQYIINKWLINSGKFSIMVAFDFLLKQKYKKKN